jgi:prepilin-type N-terminal cleavage/methylation domain-containing protein
MQRKGFSLAEIVVAMLILVMLLFSFGYLIFLSSVRTRATSHSETAVAIAENVMEKIKGLDWSSIAKGGTYDGRTSDTPLNAGADNQYPPSPYPEKKVDNSYKSNISGATVSHITDYYCVVRSFYDPEFPTTEDLLFLVVEVYWRETSGAGGSYQKSISLTSEIMKKE